MAPRNDDLRKAWRALDGIQSGDGWCTIALVKNGTCELFAGRHFPGNWEAIIAGFHLKRRFTNLPQGNGFRTEQIQNVTTDPGLTWISLSRQPFASFELFASMAEDVVGVVTSAQPPNDEILVVQFLDRIRAWQNFMQRSGQDVLGPEQEVGLFGELTVLRAILDLDIPAPTAVSAWHGPLNGLHDFCFDTGSIEVKATISGTEFSALISGLDQLDNSLVSQLFISGVSLAIDEAGITLSDLVSSIETRLETDSLSKRRFGNLILQAGFIHSLSDGYVRRFVHRSTRVLLVDDDFPKITRGTVHPAIRSAHYELDLKLINEDGVGLSSALTHMGVVQNGVS